MRVHVKLFSRLRQLLPPETRGRADVELPEGASVEHLLAHLGVTGRVQLVSVNDQRESDLSRVLQPDDQVCVFPFGVGG